ncbi:uncharacterized protein LOC141849612 [Brevipalpus obovatus]|uniref:uncharacterized protein LOC141849612 n=1 Tax=Brevipalpus obovatus TaxID=246614 RepID=UPI003D9F44E9
MVTTNLIGNFFLMVLTFLTAYVSTDPHTNGTPLYHNQTIVNCARFKRAANQHTCVLAPISTEGPYFITNDLERSDITEGKKGVKLNLEIILTNAADCTPVPDAIVHIWQSDAIGDYSGFLQPSGAKLSDGRLKPQNKLTFLRGYQVSDQDGRTFFQTIVPGWYDGRTIHIHIEVTRGQNVVYIGQFYFTERFTRKVAQISPYSTNTKRRLVNERDHIFPRDNGIQTVLKVAGDLRREVRSRIVVGIDPEASETPDFLG